MQPLTLFEGDGFNRLMARMGWPRPTLGRQLLIMSVIVFLYVIYPLELLYATGAPWQVDEFLRDYGLWAQLFAMLSLISVEGFVGRKMEAASLRLAEMVAHDDDNDNREKCQSIFATAQRLCKTGKADVGALVAAYVLGSASWVVPEVRQGILTWRTTLGTAGVHLAPAGWWVAIVYGPLFAYIWARWAWKAIVWAGFLCRISRVRLPINVCHPDRAGGLGFLGAAQVTWGILLFLFGIVYAASVTHHRVTEGGPLTSLWICCGMPTFMIAGILFFFGPLFAFYGQMHAAKKLCLDSLEHKLAAVPLGVLGMRRLPSADSGNTEDVTAPGQHLGDLTSLYDQAMKMRMLPFGVKNAVSILLSAAASQLVPYILGRVPWTELLNLSSLTTSLHHSQ